MERARNNAYNSRQIGVRLKRLFCEKTNGATILSVFRETIASRAPR